MPQYDLVVRGGTIVDGTGIPSYRADLAVKNGRVAMISGKIRPGGAKEIDAGGCIVAPGAIDLHTHYDGQLNWDPYASLSGWFGVTSLTIGQCGFGFAPTRPEDRDLSMRMMNRIEAIPLESMRLGMRWDWETFPQFMDSLGSHGLGLNVGALFPFSPLRGYVLGMLPARERTSVTEAELNRMKQLFHEGMKAGAFGFSMSKNFEDSTEDGSPLPSHVASKEEFLGLAEVLGQVGVGHIGANVTHHPTPTLSEDRKEQHAELEEMMRISGRPLHANGITDPQGQAWQKGLRAQGFPILCQHSVVETEPEFRLAEYNLFDYMPNWVYPLVGSPEERAAKLRDPEVRAAMSRDVEALPSLRTDWNRVRVVQVMHDRHYKYEGLSIEEVARMQNKLPLDAFLDLALDEELQTEFCQPLGSSADDRHEELIKNPDVHISNSDGGAHTRYFTLSTWPVHFLAHWVRDKEVMGLEEAAYKMSALPAWFSDFKDRGSLSVGKWADIIVYNLDDLGFVHSKPVYANDFPGGERRLSQKPTGLRFILVNGAVTFEENACTGALPGKLLRSYDMVG